MPSVAPQSTASGAQQQPLSNEQLQLLQLCFSEHEFGTNDVLQLFEGGSGVSGGDGAQSGGTAAAAVVASESQPTAVSALDFDPVQFIDDKIEQGIPLDVVCKDLSTFEKFLQNRILQHVHEDVYEAFVSVSGELVGVDEQLTRVYQPLSATKTRLESALTQLSSAESSVLEMLRSAEVHELHRQFHLGCAQVWVLYDALCDSCDALEASPYFRGLAQGASSTPSEPQQAQTIPDDIDINALRMILSDLLDLENSLRNLSLPQSASCRSTTTTQAPAEQTAKQQLSELTELKQLVHDARQHIITMLNNTFLAVHAVYVTSKMGANNNNNSGSSNPAARSTIQARLLDVLKSLTQAYATAGVDEFIALYRDHVVRTFVESILSWKAAAAARTSPESSTALLSELCASLSNVLFPLLPMVRQVLAATTAAGVPSMSSQGPSSADLAASGSAVENASSQPPTGSPLSPTATSSASRQLMALIYWPAICNTVVTRMVFLFLPGIAATFHKHFTAAHQLIVTLEAQCGSMSELQALRASPEMTLWSHKWNVDVYHTLRATEAKSLFEHAAQSIASLSQNQPGGPIALAGLKALEKTPTDAFPVALHATAEVANVVLWLFKDDVFLFPLSHRFLRDSVGTIRDYVKLLTSAAMSQMKSLESTPGSAAAGHGAQGGGEGTIALIGCALRDLDWLASQFIPRVFKNAVERATCEDAATCPPLANVLLRTSDMIQNQGTVAVQQTLVASLTSQCHVKLQNIRTIKAAYSHTKKPMPSSPSWFISDVLKALLDFKAGAKNGLPESLIQQICSAVIDETTTKFRELAKETIISARKTEESLGKLRRKRDEARGMGSKDGSSSAADLPASRSGGQDAATDRDKMVVQLYLDAHEYGSLLRPFGVHKERYAPLQSILKLCRRAEWLLGGDDNAQEPAEVDDDE